MVRDKNRLGRLSEIWTIDGTNFYKTFNNNMWVRPAKCFLTWSQRRQIILCRILKQHQLHQGQYNPSRDVNPVAANTAVFLRARWLFLRVSSLTHHTWVFIYILFLFLCLGNMNSLLSVTDCSDSVPTQLARLTQFTAGYECRKYGSSTHQREMKSLWGKSGQTGAMSRFLSDW